MILTNVVQDDTMGVPGFEHQTFTCSECHDLERRLSPNKIAGATVSLCPSRRRQRSPLHQRSMRSTLL
jgi:hypothetical protein